MSNYNDDEILHIKNNKLEYIEFKVLNKYNVKHCITLRHGGVSKGDFESLNFRTAGTDDIKNVLENVNIIKKELDIDNIYKARQNHTDNILILDDENKDKYLFENLNKEEFDGYITSKKDIATLVTTADCNPIIIYDPKNNVVANVHAGWKGVINKIYIKAINLLKKKYESKAQDLIICIGPSIRSCCFTSMEDSFKEKFTSVFKYENEYLKYENDGKTFHIDLIQILNHELIDAGVNEKNIHVAPICTRCNTKDFFSYREAVQNKKEDYATMATIVTLNENRVK